MSRRILLWVALPYRASSFTIGTSGATAVTSSCGRPGPLQLLERRLLMIGASSSTSECSPIGGHLLGILVPRSATEAVGVSDDAYHWLAVMGGLAARHSSAWGSPCSYRRLTVDQVAATTLRAIGSCTAPPADDRRGIARRSTPSPTATPTARP